MRRSISSARTLEMHVDGFRFDLASALARELHAVDRLSGFFDLIHQNPAMNRVKLIAEPWDVGEGGYQVGNFPPLWSEWHGKYRDTIRDFVRGADQTLAEFASRFTGSSHLYATTGRRQPPDRPGQRDPLGRLGARPPAPAGVRPCADRAAPPAPDLPAPPLVPGPRDPGAGRHRLVQARRYRDDGRRLGTELREIPRRLSQRPGHRAPGRAR